MSLNAIERLFWEIGDDPDKAKAFLNDPEGYTAQFPLTDAERRMVLTMDVKALDGHGVSNMLSMLAFQVVNGGSPLSMFEYLRRMNGGKWVNRMRLPGWQFAMLRTVITLQNAWTGVLCTLGLKKRLA